MERRMVERRRERIYLDQQLISDAISLLEEYSDDKRAFIDIESYDHYSAVTIRTCTEETDEEYAKRMNVVELKIGLEKDVRRRNYLKLREEFGAEYE
jgi:hypothetical protein